jgi:hypothetical protein
MNSHKSPREYCFAFAWQDLRSNSLLPGSNNDSEQVTQGQFTSFYKEKNCDRNQQQQQLM